jgi:hypothetical protein
VRLCIKLNILSTFRFGWEFRFYKLSALFGLCINQLSAFGFRFGFLPALGCRFDFLPTHSRMLNMLLSFSLIFRFLSTLRASFDLLPAKRLLLAPTLYRLFDFLPILSLNINIRVTSSLEVSLRPHILNILLISSLRKFNLPCNWFHILLIWHNVLISNIVIDSFAFL